MKSQEKYFHNIDSILLWSEDSGYWLWHSTRGPMVLNSDNVFAFWNITWLCCALLKMWQLLMDQSTHILHNCFTGILMISQWQWSYPEVSISQQNKECEHESCNVLWIHVSVQTDLWQILWIETRVTAWKCSIQVKIIIFLWQEHSGKGVRVGQMTHNTTWLQLKIQVVWSYITQRYSNKTFEILQVLFNMNLSIIYCRSSLWSILLSSWKCHLVWIKSNHLHCCSNRHQLQPVPLTAVWMACHHVRRVAENCTKPPSNHCPIHYNEISREVFP